MKTHTKETDKPLPTLDQMPPVPPGVSFSLKKIEKISIPHPYCIAPGHVAEAANHWGGMLGVEAIRAAEKKGIYCDICKHEGGILQLRRAYLPSNAFYHHSPRHP